MGSDWALHRIFSDISAGLLEERLRKVSQDLGQALQLRVYARLLSALDSEKHTQHHAQNHIRFRIHQSGLDSRESQQAGILGRYQNMGDFKELPKLLEDEALFYYWLDFHVVFEVPCENQNQPAACAEAFLEHYSEAFQQVRPPWQGRLSKSFSQSLLNPCPALIQETAHSCIVPPPVLW